MRSGFTTGSCAAVSTRAAVQALSTGQFPRMCQILTPKGIPALMEICDAHLQKGYAYCGVHKDAGDDPDVTNGTHVGAAVFTREAESNMWKKDGFLEKWKEVFSHGYLYQAANHVWIGILGGEGVGMVTKAGLSCPPSHAAINPVPRKMIAEAVIAGIRDGEASPVTVWDIPTEIERNDASWNQVMKDKDTYPSYIVEIRIPEGKKLAEKTFNPKLGIVDGISVLGTSGIVEPMSEDALRETIRLELHMKALEGYRYLVLTLGNYGETFLQEMYGISLQEAVKCSNFVGDAFQMAKEEGLFGILFVGHIGKLIKVSLGVMNTHSRYGDRRNEGFLEAMEVCLQKDTQNTYLNKEHLDRWEQCKKKIRQSNTSEEAVSYLKEAGYLDCVMDEIVRRIREQIDSHLKAKTNQAIEIEIVTFSSQLGILGKTSGADEMITKIKQYEKR